MSLAAVPRGAERAKRAGAQGGWDLRSIYQAMLALRAADERAAALAAEGRLSFYLSLRGDEAIYAGVAFALAEGDWLFPPAQAPDGASLELACGRPLRTVGCASPGAGRLPHAMGTAWAARLEREPVVACTVFGEAAASHPDFHVALNFAGVFRAPVLFVCRTRPPYADTAAESLTDRGEAYGIDAVRVDGADVEAVLRAVSRGAERARSGEGAILIEATLAPDADPVERLARQLRAAGLGPAEEQQAAERAQSGAEAAARRLLRPASGADPFGHVMAEPPWHLREQQRELS